MADLAKRTDDTLAEPTGNLAVLDFGPKSIQGVRDMAVILAESGIGPQIWRNPNAGVVLLMTALEMGLSVSQAFRGMFAIDGKVGFEAGLMVAIVRRHHDCQYFRLVSSSIKEATYECKRRSEPEPVRMSYTFEQAARAGLTVRPPWKAAPEDMLRARASIKLARATFQDAIYSLETREEYDDSAPQPITKTQAIVASTASRRPEDLDADDERALFLTRSRNSRRPKDLDDDEQTPPTPETVVEAHKTKASRTKQQGTRGATANISRVPYSTAATQIEHAIVAAMTASVSAAAASEPGRSDDLDLDDEKPQETAKISTEPVVEHASSGNENVTEGDEVQEWEIRMRASRTIAALEDITGTMLDSGVDEAEIGRVYDSCLAALQEAC